MTSHHLENNWKLLSVLWPMLFSLATLATVSWETYFLATLNSMLFPGPTFSLLSFNETFPPNRLLLCPSFLWITSPLPPYLYLISPRKAFQDLTEAELHLSCSLCNTYNLVYNDIYCLPNQNNFLRPRTVSDSPLCPSWVPGTWKMLSWCLLRRGIN